MAALGDSLSSSPTWAVATITALLIVFSLLIEHSLHILTHVISPSLLCSLLCSALLCSALLCSALVLIIILTMAEQPISKICISANLADTFLPCKDKPPAPAIFRHLEDADACTKGKVSLMSSNGIQQLQMLIFLLAVFHVVSSLLTLGLGEIKVKYYADPRRFKLAKQTSFGKRHLQFWSSHWLLLWIVCFWRQFAYPLSRADYFALRNGYIDAHLSPNSAYNFHKFLTRSVLLAIGTKLEVIITKTCLKSSKHKVIVPGDQVYVNPNDNLFWFGRPRWLLHAIHFILIQNSFQLAFVTWSSYKFGFQSCFHREREDFSLSLSGGIVVQFLCAYITLPLYSLVNQMGSTMRETIFSDRVVVGLKNWRSTAKKSLFSKESVSSIIMPSPTEAASSSSSTSVPASTSSRVVGSYLSAPSPGPRGLSSSRTSSAAARFEFPTRRRELEEIQKVTEEMMGASRSCGGGFEGGGEMSFRMWWQQEMTSPIGDRRSSKTVAFSGVDEENN
ncbi:MLO-like protein 2 [Platanthera guangdongensis]|uniref:MLO-like protein n=1 Tax=Platanthera guangdongensis TaxID=2320717 RepID=A0ABR2MWJ5_9ASPA